MFGEKIRINLIKIKDLLYGTNAFLFFGTAQSTAPNFENFIFFTLNKYPLAVLLLAKLFFNQIKNVDVFWWRSYHFYVLIVDLIFFWYRSQSGQYNNTVDTIYIQLSFFATSNNYHDLYYTSITKNSDPITFFSTGTFIFDLNGSHCTPKIMTVSEIVYCERSNNKWRIKNLSRFINNEIIVQNRVTRNRPTNQQQQ